jgi:hypothetical protein
VVFFGQVFTKKLSVLLITATCCVVVVAVLAQGKPPPGFVEQTLEPTGGKINKPKGWFYTETHAQENGGARLMWTLAKEDPRKGYETGFRIQYFLNVQEATGKTPQEFVASFLDTKRKEAKQIPRNCEPHKEGLFTRVCLETEEGLITSCIHYFGTKMQTRLWLPSLAQRKTNGRSTLQFSIR